MIKYSGCIVDANWVDNNLQKGVLYRSQCPAFYQGNLPDLKTYLNMSNITLRIDLRSDDEISQHPVEDLEISVEYLPVDPKSFFPEGRPDWDINDILKQVYCKLVFEETDLLNEFVRLILLNPNATLVHCVAGRDRTGILIAMVQILAGATVDSALRGFSSIAGMERTEILGKYFQELVAADGIKRHAEKVGITHEQIWQLRNKLYI